MAANSTDATWTQANSEEPDGNSGKKKGLSLSLQQAHRAGNAGRFPYHGAFFHCRAFLCMGAALPNLYA